MSQWCTMDLSLKGRVVYRHPVHLEEAKRKAPAYRAYTKVRLQMATGFRPHMVPLSAWTPWDPMLCHAVPTSHHLDTGPIGTCSFGQVLVRKRWQRTTKEAFPLLQAPIQHDAHRVACAGPCSTGTWEFCNTHLWMQLVRYTMVHMHIAAHHLPFTKAPTSFA